LRSNCQPHCRIIAVASLEYTVTLTFVGVMPRGRIQHRAWFVKFGLAVSRVAALDRSEQDRSENEQPTADLLATEIQRCLKDVVNESNQGGRQIRSLQQVSFAYKSGEMPPDLADNSALPGPANVVDVVGFVHGHESILDSTMHSWIQDPRVIAQTWTPVCVKQGTGGNWRQQDIIRNFYSDCEHGRRVRVDCLWSGDPSAPVATGGRKKRLAADPAEASAGAAASDRGAQRRAFARITVNTMRTIPSRTPDSARTVDECANHTTLLLPQPAPPQPLPPLPPPPVVDLVLVRSSPPVLSRGLPSRI